MSFLPEDFPDRYALADEVHARPYPILEAPVKAFFIATLVGHERLPSERDHLVDLCRRFGVHVPEVPMIHFTAQLGVLQLQWERHGEFSGYTLIAPGGTSGPFMDTVNHLLPARWLCSIPGRTIVAVHAEFLQFADTLDVVGLFNGNVPVGSSIGDGTGVVHTDFRIHADGCSRILVLNQKLTPREAGRMLQRLFEIEAYRMMALLALPIARRLAGEAVRIEGKLTELTAAIADEGGDDEALLHELTDLAASLERALASSQSRFAASRAYYQLVNARITALREQRLPGAQTIEGFMGRRLAPAMATCVSVSERLLDLSERVAQASSLLSTRVDIARQKQNQALLASVERRARQQLQLQETVEGLSVAAISYYVVGLVVYGAKAIKAAGLSVNPELTGGASIPVVVLIVAFAVRKARRRIVASVERKTEK